MLHVTYVYGLLTYLIMIHLYIDPCVLAAVSVNLL